MVGNEEGDDLRALDRLGDRADLEPGLLGGGARRAARSQADVHVDTRVVEVQRMGMPLAPESDDGDLAVEEVEIAVTVNRCHRVVLLFVGSDENLLR